MKVGINMMYLQAITSNMEIIFQCSFKRNCEAQAKGNRQGMVNKLSIKATERLENLNFCLELTL